MVQHKLAISVFLVGLQTTVLSSCPKPAELYITWSSCKHEPSKWFGLSKFALPHDNAASFCEDNGAQLVSDWNFNMDRCVTNILVGEAVKVEDVKTTQAYKVVL